MLRIFSNHKTKLDAPDKLFFYLDKIINICLIKIERGEIKSAKGILIDLEIFLNKFWTLKQINPGRFLSLISSQDIYENACPIKIPGHFYEMDSFDAQCADNLKVQTLLQSQLHSGREIKGFGRLLGGFEKIWEKAYHFEQQEITNSVFQILDHFLGTLLAKSFNDLFVETVLKVYLSIFERLLKVPDKSTAEYEIRASLLWYQKYQLNRVSAKKPFDDFLYEDLLDQTMYKFMILMVSAKQELAFEIFLNLLSEKTDSLSRSEHSLIDITHILEKGDPTQYEIFKKNNFYREGIEKLNQELNGLESLPNLRSWIAKEEHLFAQIRPHLDSSQLSHFHEVETDIHTYLLFLQKKQKIMEMIDVTLAYGLIRNKTFMIKSIFSYHLPYDNQHAWFVDFILPKTRCELLLFLHKKQLSVTKYNITEGLLVGESYYEKSSLILISSFLLRTDYWKEDTMDLANVLSLTENGSTLTQIRFILSSLLVAAHLMTKDQNYLADLGIPDDLKESHWKDKVIPFLEYLGSSIDQKVLDLKTEQKLSLVKIKDFRQAILSNFSSNAVLRGLFTYFNQIVSKNPLDHKDSAPRVGLNVIDEKSQFLDRWENACSLQIVDYGIKLALSEDLYVFNKIRSNCTSISWKQMEHTMKQRIDDSYIMVATDLSYQSVLLKKTEFSPDWSTTEKIGKIPFQVGQYMVNRHQIPVIVISRVKDEEGILLLRKTELGKWHQWSPLDPGDDPSREQEFLYMNIQAFSEKQELMDEFLNNPPAWLRDLGSKEKQTTYLLEHILIHIFERFEWFPHSSPSGFSLDNSL